MKKNRQSGISYPSLLFHYGGVLTIYLDNAANAPVFPEVLEAMLPWFQPDHVGNPGSIHSQGVQARKAIDNARAQVAKMIGADPSEIYFTSGGTESNNAWLKCFGGDLILTTSLEHDSVLEPLSYGTKRYPPLSVCYVHVNRDGSVNLDDLERVLSSTRNTGRAVSIMWVNNELGTVNPMREIGTLCKKYNTVFHADGVQAAGHINMDVKACGIDFCSLSGHKFGAPPGIGALYISRSAHKSPWIMGGGQESGMRGGTENVPGIVGLGKAAEIVTERLSEWKLMWGILRDAFLTALKLQMPDWFYINGDTDNYSSNIISLTTPGVHSESLLLLLDQEGVYISAGSACSAGSGKLSHVLEGIGLSDEDAACTVRISMGYDTTVEEMQFAAKAIADCSQRLKGLF